MINMLTIDLEDYYQVSAFESLISRYDWERYESRIERNTYRLLDILERCSPPTPYVLHPTPGTKATFFCLGWIAERYPHLIKEIYQQGHEIACHGYDHRIVYHMTASQFREDVSKAKKILEDIIGEGVIGYRAPSYSITQRSLWALEILAEEGYRYDSSIFPIHHDRYGLPEAPRFPFIISMNGNNSFQFSMLDFNTAEPQKGRPAKPEDCKIASPQNSNMAALKDSVRSALCPMPHASSIVEFPISTLRILGANLPIAGGGYFRLFPYSIVRKGLKRINETEGAAFVFYLHPWELDPYQPRINSISIKSRFRHYVNLNKTESKLKNLLSDFSFSSIKDLLKANVSICCLEPQAERSSNLKQ